MIRHGSAGLEWFVDVHRIERARISLGLTRRDLAKVARVDAGTVGDMLAGRRRPTFGTIRAIARALGLDLAQVIAFDASTEGSEWPIAS